MDVLLLFSVQGSLVLASNVIFAGIYVHLPNNEGSCSFRLKVVQIIKCTSAVFVDNFRNISTNSLI